MSMSYSLLASPYEFLLIEDPLLLEFQERCDFLSQQLGGARHTYTITGTGQYVVTEVGWFFPDSTKVYQFIYQVESEFGSQGRILLYSMGYLDGVIPEPITMIPGYAVCWSMPIPKEPTPPTPPEPEEELNYTWGVALATGVSLSIASIIF